jgi:hypothetical protein
LKRLCVRFWDAEIPKPQQHRLIPSLFAGTGACSASRKAGIGSVRTPFGAMRTAPSLLTGFNGRLSGAIAGALWADLEMGRIFQAITPIESVAAHNPYRLPAFWSEATTAATRRDPSDVDGQPGLVHRSARRLCTIDPAPGATTAIAGAPIDGPLLSVGAKRAVHTRPNTAFTHLPHGRVEAHTGIIIERIEAAASYRARISISAGETIVDSGQAESDCEAGKGRPRFKAQHRW